ncbi:MAG TPA: SRPBCC domain-containing protein [Thermoplasmata archaeon]
MSRIFRAPPERVFRLFTDPATLPYVFAPDPRSVTIEKIDFRKGGHYSIAVKQDDGSSIRFHGEYREIDPPRRVVNTFEVDAFPGSFAIETDEFEPVGDFTRLTVRWKYQRPADRDKMAGAEMERAVTAMWENVDDLLALGSPEAVGAGA